MAPIRIQSVAGMYEEMGEYLATVSYDGPWPEGTRFDEHGLPIVEPHPDEGADELI